VTRASSTIAASVIAGAALAALLATAQAHADARAAIAPATPPVGQRREASMDEYRSHLQALAAIVAACAEERSSTACNPALIGPDDHVPIPAGVQTGAGPERRLISYDWLRTLLEKAQQKDSDKAPGKSETGTANSDANPSAGPNKNDRSVDNSIRPPRLTTTQLLQSAEIRLAQDLAQTAAAPVAEPGRTQARQAMRQVLAGREFRNLERTSPVDSVFEKIGNWLNRLFESAARFGARSAWIGHLVFWGFIAAVFVGLVWGLIQLERRGRVRLIPESTGPAAGAASARDWQLWREDARQAAAAGKWREAIHFVYWASISRLESRRLWPDDRARTPREYLALVGAEDPRKPGLANLTGSFERIWYGGRAAQESDYRSAEQLATALISGNATSGGASK
jgi:Domain of unknown function (DUF4129)